MGDSRGAPRAYDKKTLAEYVHTLVASTLCYQQVHVVGHDLGAGVAFGYAAFHPEAATSLTMMDYPLPGPAFDDQTPQHILRHFGLHMTPQLPEQLVTGRQRTYLGWFFTNYVAPQNRIQPAAVTEFVRTYCDPDKLDVRVGGYLADDLARVSHALVVPLGDSAGAAVAHLVRRVVRAEARCLRGFPHPYGGNEGAGGRGVTTYGTQHRRDGRSERPVW